MGVRRADLTVDVSYLSSSLSLESGRAGNLKLTVRSERGSGCVPNEQWDSFGIETIGKSHVPPDLQSSSATCDNGKGNHTYVFLSDSLAGARKFPRR